MRYFITLFAIAGAIQSPRYDGVIRSQPDGSEAAYFIPPFVSNHASTLEELPDGRLIAAWFSGVAEEANNCSIVVSILDNGKWSPAKLVSRRSGYSNQNPVLYYDNDGSMLHLFHSQAPAKSGESQATIVHLQSSDLGSTWSEPAQWLTAPGSFPRNRIIPRLDGSTLFPFYNSSKDDPKFMANYAIIGIGKTVSSSAGWSFQGIHGSENLVQPSTVRPVKGSPNLTTFFRDRRAEHIYVSYSKDDGASWTDPVKTVLPNNNAGIEANILPGTSSNSIVMAFNPQTSGRDPLAIAISHDGGLTWPDERNLQHGKSTRDHNADGSSDEFSYPSVLVTKDGKIHVTFTYLRETIKYMTFDASWVKKQ